MEPQDRSLDADLVAGRPLQGRGTALPQDNVSGCGSTTTRSWNPSTTTLDAGPPLQGRGTARLRLWTRVEHYKVVDLVCYFSASDRGKV